MLSFIQQPIFEVEKNKTAVNASGNGKKKETLI